MIEVNGIYKLKQIEGLSNNDDNDYKVLAIDKDAKHETAYCENLTNIEIPDTITDISSFSIGKVLIPNICNTAFISATSSIDTPVTASEVIPFKFILFIAYPPII